MYIYIALTGVSIVDASILVPRSHQNTLVPFVHQSPISKMRPPLGVLHGHFFNVYGVHTGTLGGLSLAAHAGIS